MKRIKRFESFNESLAFDMISETVLYFLPEIRYALTTLAENGDEIARQLLAKSKKDTLKDITFVDMEGETLSFMSKGAVDSKDPELMNDLWGNTRTIEDEELVKSIKGMPNRSSIKIGKFVNSILGPIPNTELEDFVNKIKSISLSEKDKGYKIMTVEGDEIKKYYRSESITKLPAIPLEVPVLHPLDRRNTGNNNQINNSLEKSCMKDKEKANPSVFDIYTKNPEICKLLIMLDKNGMLVSRALLWKVSKAEFEKLLPNGRVSDEPREKMSFWFMDRIYSIKDWMDKSMREWAISNGMAHRKNSWSALNKVSYDGMESSCEMEVDIRKISYKGFPYMDTFTFYDVKNGKLRNYKTPGFEGFSLQSLRGGFESTTGKAPVFRNYIRRFKL